MLEIFVGIFASIAMATMYYSPSFCSNYGRRSFTVEDPDIISVEVCDVPKEPSFERVNLRTLNMTRLRELDRKYAGTETGERIHDVRKIRIEGLLLDRKRKREMAREKTELVETLIKDGFDLGRLSLSELKKIYDAGGKNVSNI